MNRISHEFFSKFTRGRTTKASAEKVPLMVKPLRDSNRFSFPFTPLGTFFDSTFCTLNGNFATSSTSAPTGFVNVSPQFNVLLGNYSNFLVNQSAVIVNEDSYDVDFRVESNSNTHALFVDAGNSRVGINTVPDMRLDILGGNGDQLVLDNGGERFTQQYFQNNHPFLFLFQKCLIF